MMLFIALASLGLTGAGGLLSMAIIRRDSEAALVAQMAQSLQGMVAGRAHGVDSELEKYAGLVRTFATYIHELYQHPGDVASRYVKSISMENANVYAMQRSLARRDVTLGEVRYELLLLGNAEHIWKPIMANYNRLITSMYLATESGLMLSYDAQSQNALPEKGEQDTYYDYFKSVWYRRAKSESRTIFTDIYHDAFGRGLTITCAAPFYDEEGSFAGVVAMDILISDMYHSIVSFSLGEGAYAFLVDSRGNLISPMSSETAELRNLYYEQDIGLQVASQILKGKPVSMKDDVYYAYALVPSTGWKFCIRVPRALILSSARSMNHNVLITILLFLAAGIWIVALIVKGSGVLSDRLAKPIVALRKDVEKISEGNLDFRAEIYDGDEIGDLAEGFNNMADSLKAYVTNLSIITAERERIGAELNIATQIQADLLPCTFPPFPDRREFAIYASMTPAKEVGGDFYDFFFIDHDHLALVMADVVGKGVPAALFMVIAKTLIKNRARLGGTPSEILNSVNDQLCDESKSDLFVTVWLGILEISTGKVASVNAGHEYPAIRRGTGAYRLMQLGSNLAVATLEGIKFHENNFFLRPGDSLFLYTDGLAEATRTVKSPADQAPEELYGVSRMLDALNRHASEPVEELLVSMKREIDAFVGDSPQFDDITMLALQYYGEGGKPMEEEHEEGDEELTIRAVVENLEEVLAFVDKCLEGYGCSPYVQTQIDLAVEEIFINIASYAYAPDTGLVTVRCELSEELKEAAIIILMDSGVPFDPLARPDPDVTLSAEERPIGGLGIYMVKKTMDRVSYEHKDGRNIFRMQKCLKAKGE